MIPIHFIFSFNFRVRMRFLSHDNIKVVISPYLIMLFLFLVLKSQTCVITRIVAAIQYYLKFIPHFDGISHQYRNIIRQ
jgi:hypothetical protein